MSAIAHVARDWAFASSDTLYVNAITGLTLAAASTVLLHYGSFARALAAIGLAPSH